MENPYLKEYRAAYEHELKAGRVLSGYDDAPSGYCSCSECIADQDKGFMDSRRRLIRRYSFAIPSEEAIAAIANLRRTVVEFGAGSGYWASLLREKGVDVLAFDAAPPGSEEWNNPYGFAESFTDVYPATGPEFMEACGFAHDFALMLCWPDYNNSFAGETLRAYRGDLLVYVGEGPGGCTADDAFFEELASWTLIREVEIPRWAGIRDGLEIYLRREAPGENRETGQRMGFNAEADLGAVADRACGCGQSYELYENARAVEGEYAMLAKPADRDGWLDADELECVRCGEDVPFWRELVEGPISGRSGGNGEGEDG